MKYVNLTIFAMLIFSMTFFSCSDKQKDAEQLDENVLTEDTPPPNEPAPIKKVKQIEKNLIMQPFEQKPGVNDETINFDTIRIDQTYSKGTLPPIKGKIADKPGDFAIRKLVYARKVTNDIREVRGFIIEKQYPPKKIEGFAKKHIEQIKVTLEMGKVEDVNFSSTWINEKSGKVKSADPQNILKDIFVKQFILRPDEHRQYWSFASPIEINATDKDALQLSIEIISPELDPTIPLIEPDMVRLIINNKFMEDNVITLVDPVKEERKSACYGSPRGQMACLYTSGAAYFYVVSPFVKSAMTGHWKQDGDFLRIYLDNKTEFELNTSKPNQRLSLGVYGDGYVIQQRGNDRLHPYYDLAMEISNEKAFSADQISHVTRTQISASDELEVVATLKDGGFAVFERVDGFSPYKLMKLVEVQGTETRVAYVPPLLKSVVAIKKPDYKAWLVHDYEVSTAKWARFYRGKVPWTDFDEEPEFDPIPLDPSENMSPEDIKYKQEQERLAKEKAEKEAKDKKTPENGKKK